MLHSDTNDNDNIHEGATTPYQSHPQSSVQSNQPDYSNPGDPRSRPDEMQVRLPMWGTPPPDPSNNRLPSGSRGWRSGAILALTLVLLMVFGVGLFSGWVFAHNGIVSAYGSNALN